MLLAFASIPRRPVVFFQGDQVDQEHGASILSWLTFSWSVLDRAGTDTPENSSLKDISGVAHGTRVRDLSERLRVGRREPRLWKQLVHTFSTQLTQQWLLVFCTAISEFLSRYTQYRLLQSLERQAKSDDEVWLWVAGLGLSLLTETIISGWLSWVTQWKLQMPMIALLNALTLGKTTRRQLAYETASSLERNCEKKQDQQSGPSLTNMINNDRFASYPFLNVHC